MKDSNHISIILLIVVVLGAGIYFFFMLQGDDAATEQKEAVLSNEVLVALEQIRSITISDSVFSREDYRTLSDYSMRIVNEPVGRSNPFASSEPIQLVIEPHVTIYQGEVQGSVFLPVEEVLEEEEVVDDVEEVEDSETEDNDAAEVVEE